MDNTYLLKDNIEMNHGEGTMGREPRGRFEVES